MRLALSLFFIIIFVPLLTAQDTLMYKNYIDYERRDHFAVVKNTIITRDGSFLPNGSYCFRGNKKDFELLLKTSSAIWVHKNVKIDSKSELYLVGEIKDSIKVGIWKLIIKNKDLEGNQNVMDSMQIENYLPIGGPKMDRYRYFNTNMQCEIQPPNYKQDIRCRDTLNRIYFSEHFASFKEEPDVGRYMRHVSCYYPVEKENYVRERDEWEKYEVVMNDMIRMDSWKKGDTIRTYLRADAFLQNHIFVDIKIIEVIRDNKLVYFNIDKDLPEKIEERFKDYNFYPEIMYNLTPCWELGR